MTNRSALRNVLGQASLAHLVNDDKDNLKIKMKRVLEVMIDIQKENGRSVIKGSLLVGLNNRWKKLCHQLDEIESRKRK